MTATVQRQGRKYRARAAQRYTAAELTGLFFAFAAIGWLWEVGLHLALEGELVNRGTMLGPWLPIYGAGGVLAVLLLRRFADRPVLTFALGTALCTAVEYGTGKYLLAVYGQRWWDYSMYPLNIDGLVSPLTSLLFGLGCFMYYASDVCLGLYLFKFRNKWVDSVNSLLYFPGMLLVALSLLV